MKFESEMRGLVMAFGVASSFCLNPHLLGAGAVEEAAVILSRGGAWVAASQLERVLEGDRLAGGERRRAELLLAEAFFRTGRFEKAAALVSQMPEEPRAQLWLGEVALKQGRWMEAASAFEKALAAGVESVRSAEGLLEALVGGGERERAAAWGESFLRGNPGADSVRAGLISVWVDLGRVEGARREWLQLPEGEGGRGVVREFLEGRLWMAEGARERASLRFSEILVPGREVPASAYVGAALGQSEILSQTGGNAEAIRFLSGILRGEPELAGVEALYARLSSLITETPDASVEEFARWSKQGGGERRGWVLFYLAQTQLGLGKGGAAMEVLAEFCREFPGHPRRAEAFLQRAEVEMSKRNLEVAGALLEEGLRVAAEGGRLEGEFRMRRGTLRFQQGRYGAALEEFERVGVGDAKNRALVGYNMALAAMALGDLRRGQAELQRLRGFAEGRSLAEDLELELALKMVREDNPNGEEALRGFLKAHPEHKRRGDARLALAEMCFRESSREGSGQRGEALRERSREYLRVVQEDPQSPRSAAQAGYLAVFLADDPGGRDEGRVLELGEAFLKEHAESPLVSAMRMKLGEVYLRRKDYANAETHFVSAARQAEGETGLVALYLAGQCASGLLNPGSVDRALGYWDKVAQANGALRWEARYQQAAVKSRLGDEKEAVVLYDLILAGGAGVSAELRFSARCGKADALLALARRSGDGVEEAVGEFRGLAAEEGVPAHWRNQALYKIGKAWEGAKNPEQALEAFYKVLEMPGSAEAGEFFWVFKAGFDASRLLEGRGQWRDAVALYERLGGMGGPRSGEALARARQIRLERFLWE